MENMAEMTPRRQYGEENWTPERISQAEQILGRKLNIQATQNNGGTAAGQTAPVVHGRSRGEENWTAERIAKAEQILGRKLNIPAPQSKRSVVFPVTQQPTVRNANTTTAASQPAVPAAPAFAGQWPGQVVIPGVNAPEVSPDFRAPMINPNAGQPVPESQYMPFNPIARMSPEERERYEARRQQQREYKESVRANVAELSANLDREVAGLHAKWRADDDKKRRDNPLLYAMSSGRSGGGIGAMPSRSSQSNTDPHYQNIVVAKQMLDQSQKIIDQADRETASDSNFIKGAGYGLRDGAFDIGTWDMGISEMAKASGLYVVAQKADRGEALTPDEDMLLTAAAVSAATEAFYGSTLGHGYKAGSVTAFSVPFMLEMLINPASGLGKGVSKSVVKYGLKKFGKEAMKSGVGKLAQAGARVAADVVGSGTITATTGAVHTAADAVSRKTGQVQFDADGKGRITYGGTEGGEQSWGAAFGKAAVARTIENYSEMFGEYFLPIGAALKGTWPMQALRATRIGKVINNLSSSDWAKAVRDFERHSQWQGTVAEWGEEAVGTALNAMFVGDSRWSDLTDADQQIDTFLGVAMMGGFMSAIKTPGYRTPEHRARKDVERAEEYASLVFGPGWNGLRLKINRAATSDTGDELNLVLTEVLSSDMPAFQKRAVFEYGARANTLRGVMLAKEKAADEVRRNPAGDTAKESLLGAFSEQAGDRIFDEPVRDAAEKAGGRIMLDRAEQGDAYREGIVQFRRSLGFSDEAEAPGEMIARDLMGPLMAGDKKRAAKEFARSGMWSEFIATSFAGAGLRVMETDHGATAKTMRKTEAESLGRINDTALKQSVYGAMHLPTIAEQSAALAGIDWSAVAPMDMALVADYVKARTEGTIYRGAGHGAVNAERFKPIRESVMRNLYRGTDGIQQTGEVVVGSTAGGRYAVIAGDVEGGKSGMVLAADRNGNVRQMPVSEFTGFERHNARDYLSQRYEELAGSNHEAMQLEDAQREVEDARAAGIPVEVAQPAIVSSVQTYTNGDVVMTTDGREATIYGRHGMGYRVIYNDGEYEEHGILKYTDIAADAKPSTPVAELSEFKDIPSGVEDAGQPAGEVIEEVQQPEIINEEPAQAETEAPKWEEIDEIPLDKDGAPDFTRMSPVMLGQQLEQLFGSRQEARDTIVRMIESNRQEAEKLGAEKPRTPAELNKYAKRLAAIREDAVRLDRALSRYGDMAPATVTVAAAQKPTIPVRKAVEKIPGKQKKRKSQKTGNTSGEKKISNKEFLATLGDLVSIEDIALREIAAGKRFAWNDIGVKRGLATELGFKGSKEEFTKRIGLLKQNGATLDQWAEQLYGNHGNKTETEHRAGFGPFFNADDIEIKDILLDIMYRIYNPANARKILEDMHRDRGAEHAEAIAEWEAEQDTLHNEGRRQELNSLPDDSSEIYDRLFSEEKVSLQNQTKEYYGDNIGNDDAGTGESEIQRDSQRMAMEPRRGYGPVVDLGGTAEIVGGEESGGSGGDIRRGPGSISESVEGGLYRRGAERGSDSGLGGRGELHYTGINEENRAGRAETILGEHRQVSGEKEGDIPQRSIGSDEGSDGSATVGEIHHVDQRGRAGRGLPIAEQQIAARKNDEIDGRIGELQQQYQHKKSQYDSKKREIGSAYEEDRQGALFAEPAPQVEPGALFDVPRDLSESNIGTVLQPIREEMERIEREIEDAEAGRDKAVEDAIQAHRAQLSIEAAEAAVDIDPSHAQKEAGNYRKGHCTAFGFDITIENPKGSVRSGVDADGKEWSQQMNHTYGYIKGTEGKDGDHIDIFIGNNPASSKVFVVDQVDPRSGKFDEHKVMLGFDSIEAAEAAYRSNYEKGWQGLGAITETPLDSFQKWTEGDTRKSKPFSEYKSVKQDASPVAANTPSSSRSKKIDDFGEKIGGARKDLAAEYISRLGEMTDKRLMAEPLSKVFPKPDFTRLVAAGHLSEENALFLRYIYENLPVKPRQFYLLKTWVGEVQQVASVVGAMIQANPAGDPLADFIRKHKEAGKKHVAREAEIFVEVAKAFGFPKEEFNPGNYSITTTRGSNNYTIMRGRFMVKSYGTLPEAIDALRNILVAPKAARNVALNVYINRSTKEVYIGKPMQGKFPFKLKGDFKTSKDAFEYLRENRAELEALWNRISATPEERRATNNPRRGVDWRNGRDVTPGQFTETFRFRGVEFGNWVTGPERQQALNDAYDALMDLSGVLGKSPAALSLNGELALAFGARGGMGTGSASSAHYESDKVVINLTKTRGAGSLAHEWFHALDNYFSRHRGEWTEYMTNMPRRKTTKTDQADETRQEVLDAFSNVMAAIKESGMHSRSLSLDEPRMKSYWSRNIEMAARAFESYVIEKLDANNESNDFLANYKNVGEWINQVGFSLENYPYPNADETPAFREKFDQLFDAIQEKVDAQTGNTLLFRDTEAAEEETLEQERTGIIARAESDGTYLKAPNGEATNLSPEQWVTVRTRAFKEWFGDWENDPGNASKVVDDNGEPMVVYHGTREEFTVFRTKSNDLRDANAAFFTDKLRVAKDYGGTVVEAFLNIRDAVRFDAGHKPYGDYQDGDHNHIENIVIKASEHSTPEDRTGVIITRIKDSQDGMRRSFPSSTVYAVFQPEQVKSATDNTGAFDAAIADIRFRNDNVKASGKITSTIIEATAEALRTTVRIVSNVDDIEDPSIDRQRRKRRSKGWYDMKTGEVVVVLPNHVSEADAQATVLHEVVGHKGMGELFGKRYDHLLAKVWDSLDERTRAKLSAKYDSPTVAAEEYIAGMAEGNVTPGRFIRVMAQVREWLREVLHLDIKVSDNDIAFMLWKAKNRLATGSSALAVAELIARERTVRRKLYGGTEDYRYRNLFGDDATGGQVHHAVAEYVRRNGVTSRLLGKRYDAFVRKSYEGFGEQAKAVVGLGHADSIHAAKNYMASANMEKLLGEDGFSRFIADLVEELPEEKRQSLARRKSERDSLRFEQERRSRERDWFDPRNKNAAFLASGKVFYARKNPLFLTKDQHIRNWQDSHYAVKKFQDLLEENFGLEVDSSMDIYNSLNHSDSKAAAAEVRYEKRYIRPMLKTMSEIVKRTGLTTEQVIDYITCESALERHESGINTIPTKENATEQWNMALVQDTIRDMHKRTSGTELLGELWEAIDKANLFILDTLVDSGMITAEQKALMRGHGWKHYVPLIGYDLKANELIDPLQEYDFGEVTHKVSRGVYMPKAEGRATKPHNPISNMILFGSRVIRKTKFNEALHPLADLCSKARSVRGAQATDPIFQMRKIYYARFMGKWKPIPPDQTPDKETLERSKAVRKKLREMERNLREAERNGNQDDAAHWLAKIEELQPLEEVREIATDFNARGEIPTGFREDMERSVEYYINGTRNVITFADPAIARAINGDIIKLSPGIDRTLGRLTRWMAVSNTMLDPSFVISNSLRDIQHAAIVHAIDKDSASVRGFVKNLPSSFKPIYRGVTGKGKPLTMAEANGLDVTNREDREKLVAIYGERRVLDTLFDLFVEQGGQTGFVFTKELSAIEKDLKRYVALHSHTGRTLLGRAMNSAKFDHKLQDAELVRRRIMEYVQAVSEISENCSRFATFLGALDSGKDVFDAVTAAKNITVNFNRRGRYSRVFGLFYIFYNATVQGLAQTARVAKRNPERFTLYVVNSVAIGFLISLLAKLAVDIINGGRDGDGDDDDKKYFIPLYVRMQNIVIPFFSGKGYAKIPQPQGLRVYHAWGAILYDASQGYIPADEAADKMMKAIWEEHLPVPAPENASFARTVTPSVMTPWLDCVQNEDTFGRPLGRTAYNETTPGSELGLKNANAAITQFCRRLNSIGGGDETWGASVERDGDKKPWKALLFEWNPSHVQHIMKSYAGGTIYGGRFFWNLRDTGKAMISSDIDVEARDVPIFNRLIGQAYEERPHEAYYERMKRLERLHTIYTKYRKDGNPKAENEDLIRNEIRYRFFHEFDKQRKAIRKALETTDPQSKEYDELSEQVSRVMKTSNDIDNEIDWSAPDWQEQLDRLIEQQNE